MDVLMFISGLFFSLFLVLATTEYQRIFKIIAITNLIICISCTIYLHSINRVITDTYMITDTINIYNIRFNKPMKIKIVKHHIPYCSELFDRTEILIGEKNDRF